MEYTGYIVYYDIDKKDLFLYDIKKDPHYDENFPRCVEKKQLTKSDIEEIEIRLGLKSGAAVIEIEMVDWDIPVFVAYPDGLSKMK